MWQDNAYLSDTCLAKFAKDNSDVIIHEIDSDESESEIMQIKTQNGIYKKENSISTKEE